MIENSCFVGLYINVLLTMQTKNICGFVVWSPMAEVGAGKNYLF